MNKEVKCLIVLNCSPVDVPAKVRTLDSYFPGGTCKLTTRKIYTSDPSEVASELDEFDADLIVQYGLGNGLLYVSDNFRGIPSVNSDFDISELLGIDHKMGSVVFPSIKEIFTKIDEKKAMPSKLYVAKTRKDLEYVVNRCMTEPFGADTETNFLNPFLRSPEPFLVCYSVAWHSDEEEGWCIPTCQKLIESGECEFTVEEALASAEKVFFESTQPQDWQNFHYDSLVLWELFGGRQPKNFRADTMLLFSMFHKAMKSASLAENVEMLGLPVYKEAAKEWIASQPKKKKGQEPYTFGDVPLEIIAPYAAMDAIAVVRGVNFMRKRLSKKQWEFYYLVAHEVLLCSIELCINGYEISQDRYNYTKLSVESNILEAHKDCMEVVKDHVDATFNMNSNQQLGDLLYKKLDLPVLHKTNSGAAAVGSKVLDDLILFHPFIFYLAKLKKLTKLYSSYVLGYTNVLGPGSRHFPTKSEWIFNAQLRQINRTARLSSSNMYGYKGTKKKGGNILTLPAGGSMVKHYFQAKEVVEVENELYREILETLKETDEAKYLEVTNALSQDVAKAIKPVKPAKEPKTPKVSKKQAVVVEEVPDEDAEIEYVPLDMTICDEVPWD